MSEALLKPMRLRWNSLLLGVVGASWVFIYEETFGDLPLGLFAGGGLLLLVGKWRWDRFQTLGPGVGACAWSYLRSIWFAVVLSWAYGFVLGWCLGNPPENILRNFFGLTLYAFAPLFLCARISTRQVINLMTFGGVAQSLWGAYAVLSTGGVGRKLELGSLSDYRSIYSTGFVCIFPLFSLVFALNVFPDLRQHRIIPSCVRRLGGNPFALIVVGCLLVVPSMSKGIILAAVMLGAFIILAAVCQVLQQCRVSLKLMVGCAMVFGAVLYFAVKTYSEWGGSFTSEEPSNLVRTEQATILASEFEWAGNGLGARLKSGYARDEAGYGFELTYLNLIHKLGFTVVPIFLLYGGTVIFAARLAFSTQARVEGVVALGAMGYLVVGAGNPILLSAPAVSLHLLALVLVDNGTALLSRSPSWANSYGWESVHA